MIPRNSERYDPDEPGDQDPSEDPSEDAQRFMWAFKYIQDRMRKDFSEELDSLRKQNETKNKEILTLEVVVESYKKELTEVLSAVAISEDEKARPISDQINQYKLILQTVSKQLSDVEREYKTSVLVLRSLISSYGQGAKSSISRCDQSGQDDRGESMIPLKLDDWRDRIDQEAPNVDVLPYSHNIISLSLQAIAKSWGDEEANRAIRDFDLEALGWKQRVIE